MSNENCEYTSLPISKFDREMIHEIIRGNGDWFSAHLVRLINKADTNNKEILRSVYPEHVEAYEDWYFGRGFYAKDKD